MAMKWNQWMQPRSMIGLIIILIGLLLLLENFGFDIDINLWDWWPLILIFIGLGHLSRSKPNTHILSGWIFIILGLLFISNNYHFLGFEVWDLWPVFIILLGLSLLGHIHHRPAQTGEGDALNQTFIMGGGTIINSSKTLKGGNLTAIMGGGEIDLTSADMAGNEMVLDIFAFWGGVELRIPKTWQVEVRAVQILGGVDNKASTGSAMANKKLIITGTAIMGGIEIKN